MLTKIIDLMLVSLDQNYEFNADQFITLNLGQIINLMLVRLKLQI